MEELISKVLLFCDTYLHSKYSLDIICQELIKMSEIERKIMHHHVWFGWGVGMGAN
jgi:hypothetical protein